MENVKKEYLLHKVDGFNPYDHLEVAVDQATGEEILSLIGEKLFFLPARMQETWFRLKYPDGKITLEQIESPHDKVKFCARIYQDKKDNTDEYVAEAYAEKTVYADAAFPPFESCQTIAVARALTIAGFGCEIKAFVAGETTKQGDVNAPQKTSDDPDAIVGDVFTQDKDQNPAEKSAKPRKRTESKGAAPKQQVESKPTVGENDEAVLAQFIAGISATEKEVKEEAATQENEHSVEEAENLDAIVLEGEIIEGESDDPEEAEYQKALTVKFDLKEAAGPLVAHIGKTLKQMHEGADTVNVFKLTANSSNFKNMLPDDVSKAILTIYNRM